MLEENKINDPLPKLGPPMGLAETRVDDFAAKLRRLRLIYKTVMSLLILFLAFSMGIYLILSKVYQNEDTFRTDIVMIRGLQDISNVTIFKNDTGLNKTFKNCNRQKREAKSSQKNGEKIEDVFKNLSDTEIMKAREMIANHKPICNKENQNEVCRDIVMKLKSITQHDHTSKITQDREVSASYIRTNEKFSTKEGSTHHFDEANRLTTISKRETPTSTYADKLSTNLPLSFEQSSHPHNLPHAFFTRLATSQGSAHSNCPNRLRQLTQDSYYATNSDYLPQQEYPISYTGYYNPSKSRSIETRLKRIHPQDEEIFKRFLEEAVKTRNSTLREAPCPEGSILCANGNECLDEKQWCDGYTDCTDISDETQCSCKSRVDKSRLCDGYFDCPYGEDELGCFGCSENTFSCEGQDSDSQKTCFSKEQRCDGRVNCPNSYDEIDCNLLSPNLLEKPMYAVSNTEGFLQRNFKGKWYAICRNPYMWAHDVCRREAGIVVRPPIFQTIHIDPAQKISYLNTDPMGIVYRSEKCLNSTAVYVTCPDLLCGTRIISTSQLIKQKAKEYLFGRNKRYLSRRQSYYSPFYNSHEYKDYFKSAREKRVLESRVVGGQASQPAAWPWMVALYRDGSFHCGSVILSQKWVMSAAHCVSKFWDHYYEIQVGMLRRFSFSPQEHNHRVTHILVNRNYDKEDMKNDLSLLMVEPDIQFSRWVRPVCLPTRETAGPDWLWGPKEGTTCIAVGWGATAERGMDPDHLREVEVPIWAQCKRKEDREGKEICAGFFQGGKDACQGDSGGPLLCKNPSNAQQWYVAGIVSHGNGCARRNEPGVYTRVSLFVKWIKSTIASNNLPTIQPKQECPGFKCMSGVTRCLPKKRVCDTIIDCLAGEDEIYNCNFRSAHTSSENMQENLTSVHDNIKINSTFNIFNEDLLSEKPEENENQALSVTELVNNMISNVIHATSESLLGETTDIAKVANEEIKSKENFEQFVNISHTTENSTEDPLDTTSSIESTETTRGDYSEYAFMTSTQDQLQTKSLKRNGEQTRSQNKEADINEDWPDTFSNPETSTSGMTTEKQTTQNTINHNQEVLTVTEKITVTTNEMITEKETKTLEMVHFASSTPTLSHKTNKDIGEQSIGTLKNNITLHDSLIISSLPKISDGIQNKRGVPLEKKNTVKLLPAKIRKSHRVPKDFTCGRIYQVIPYHQRCNQKADCEDGTDELSCTCLDYVTTFNNELICDGIFDCAEGEDESDCYGCDGENFLCKKSGTCLPSRYVCNGKFDCPQGEDESECLTLTNGREIFYDFAGKPNVNVEGFLTRKHSNEWHVVCENNRLFADKQEETATHVCRYLGFSSAIRFMVKYINIIETGQNKSQSLKGKLRSKRTTLNKEPVHFMYREADEDENSARDITIEKPDFIKERCVPNVTKTCTSLYIVCDQSLFTNFENPGLLSYERSDKSTTSATWPWIAKVFVEGNYKCTGVLIDVSWVLISHLCLLDSLYSHATPHISVVLGSHRTLNNVNGPYEQTYHVNGKIDIFHSKAILLHMREPAFYSAMVKPMMIPYINPYYVTNKTCVAIGEDNENTTISIFLEETNEKCDYNSVCFKRETDTKICLPKKTSQRPWAGIISCHTSQGWYPMATFVDSRGECGVEDRINATEIGNIRNDIKLYLGKTVSTSTHFGLSSDTCEGERCGRGRCIGLQQLCDGVKDCENGNDESENACEKKNNICDLEPYHKGCECTSGQMKCHNGRCIAKELFRDGFNDCGDSTDEPAETTCSDYLRTVMPSRLCDGILHCEDRSDEDPSYCKCHAKNAHSCGRYGQDLNNCVAPDMVCDGIRDCPNGEDESTCSALSSPPGTPHGTGLVIVRSHGQDWHAKCFPTQHHTRFELENICKQLGFLGGHAKQLIAPGKSVYDVPTEVILDPFREIVLNNKTKIKLRNTDMPIARTVLSKNFTNCYSLFIECL